MIISMAEMRSTMMCRRVKCAPQLAINRRDERKAVKFSIPRRAGQIDNDI